ncbi:hypothetical protein BCD67_16905 [Oscillatoriales cyanobacterium USR001]|nr:hypothetical protein BCD67_16905 [Oscillatoriales cyanobacterium USR001]
MSKSSSRRLLILSCSQAKRSQKDDLPAIERYDGPSFRLLRRFLRQQPDTLLDIYVLSAKFGLIRGDLVIPNYDQKMSKALASELSLSVVTNLEAIVSQGTYQKLLICVTKMYFNALSGYSGIMPDSLEVTVGTGTLGRKLSILHQWLYGNSWKFSEPITNGQRPDKILFKGIEFNLTDVNFDEVARQALAQGKGKPYNYQTWYILIDHQKISPKWLVSQLTGLPVSSFHSQAARQLLQRLGIQVYSDL